MKAVICDGFGEAAVLKIGEIAPPALKEGQVRIRVHASGVNRADIHQRRGNYPPPPGESNILGLEVAGEIVETASSARDWKPGDRIMALLAGGGYAEEACVDEGLVMPLPSRLSYSDGAAIPEAFVTAYLNLFTLGKSKPGDAVLIHAGASGVGTAAIQLLVRIGARVFTTVGSAEKAVAVTRLGARAIQYRTEKFQELVRHETQGLGVNVILDPIGGDYVEANFKCLAVDGRLIQIAYMGGRDVRIDLATLMAKRIRFIGSTLRPLPLKRKCAAVAAWREEFLADFKTGTLRPIIDKVFPAEDVRAAHEHMEANRNVGKILLAW